MNAYMNITVRTVTAQAQREIDYLRKRVAELEAQLAAAGGTATRAFGGSALNAISKWGSQIQWAGRQLTANFTAPLALAGGLVTKWVLDNESGMIRIKKVYGDAATGAQEFTRDVEGLSEAFDLLSTKYATQRADVLDIAGDWAAAGATGGALARGVEATLQTMVLGEMEAADATEALIAIQAQYGANTEQLIGIVETLNATENTTGVTFQGLVDGMSRSASAARSAGVDVDHLAAMIAAISPAAGSAGQAGNALKTIFSRMLGPTGEARDVLGAMGINIDDVAWKSLNGAERLERLADAYMHLEGAGEGMVSSQAGIVSAVVASRWQINRFDVLMRDLAYHIDGNSDTNGYYTKTLEYLADKSAVAMSAQRELNAVLESNPYAVKRAGVVIQNSLMKVVAALLPQIMWLVNSIATLAQKFSELNPSLQKLIIGFAAFLALLGPPIVLLGTMAVAIGQIGKIAAAILSPIKRVATAFSGMFSGAKKQIADTEALATAQATQSKARVALLKQEAAEVRAAASLERAEAAAVAQARKVADREAAASARALAAEQKKLAAGVSAAQKRYAAELRASDKITAANKKVLDAEYVAQEAMKAKAAEAAIGKEVALRHAGTAEQKSALSALHAYVMGLYSQELVTVQSIEQGKAAAAWAASAEMQAAAVARSNIEDQVMAAILRAHRAADRSITASAAARTDAEIVLFGQARAVWNAMMVERIRQMQAFNAYYAQWTGARQVVLRNATSQEVAIYTGGLAAQAAAQDAWLAASVAKYAAYRAKIAAMLANPVIMTPKLNSAALQAMAANAGLTSGIDYARSFQAGVVLSALENSITFSMPKLVAASTEAGVVSGRAYAAGQASGMLALGPAPVLRQITAAAPAVVAASGATGIASGRAIGTGIKVGLMTSGKAALAGVGRFIAGLGPMILAGLRAVGPRVVAAFSGPWGWAILAVSSILTLFGKQIGEFFSNILKQFNTTGTGLNNAWKQITDLFGRAIGAIQKAFNKLPEAVRAPLVAVVTMVRDAALKVYEWFSYINPFAHHSPSLVENVTNGMAIVGDKFGLAANEIKRHMMSAYGTLKSFGSAVASFMRAYDKFTQSNERSLILEMVGKKGVAAYNALKASLVPLYADLEKVNAAIEKQAAKVAQLEGEVQAAQAVLDSAQAKLDKMSTKLYTLGDALEAAKSSLQTFADSPIEGMRAMSDAIFENELAQKKLRLEMMKLGDVDISDLEGQLASLQGEIEMLKGEQSSLQQSGAGSDILGAYDDQIKALEAQQGAINDSVAPLNEMQKQLEELQRAGEILDLENAIQFDPLQRQIDQLSESYSELPFDQIMAGITEQKSAVDELQAAYDAQNSKVEEQQKVVDQAQASVDAATAAYDAQKAVLDGLQETYDAIADQISEIEQAIQDVVSAAQDMQAALEAAKSASGSGDEMSPALENFLGAAGGSFPDVGDAFTIGDEDFSIDDWLDEFMAGTGDLFGQVDMLAPFKEGWQKVVDWWNSLGLGDLFGNIGSGIADAFGAVDWLGPIQSGWNSVIDFFGGGGMRTIGEIFGSFWADIQEDWTEAWGHIKDTLSESWNGTIKPTFDKFKKVWDPLYQKMEPVLSFLGEWVPKILGGVVVGVLLGVIALIMGAVTTASTVISNVVTTLVNIITGIVNAVVTFFGGIINGLIMIWNGLIDFVKGVFTGNWSQAWDGIKQIFAGVWEQIYGIVVGTWELIVAVFGGAWDLIYGIIRGLVEGVVDFFTWLWDVLVGHSIIPDTVEAIIEWFQKLWDDAVALVMGLVNAVVDWFKDMYTKTVNKVKEIYDSVVKWFGDLWTGVVEKVTGMFNAVKQWFIDMKDAIVNKVSETVDKVVEWFKGLPGKALDALGNLKETLSEKGKTLINGLWNGIKDKWDSVTEWFGDIGDKVKGVFDNAKNWLKDAGKHIFEGLYTGMKNKWDEITGWIGDIGGWIADHKGPKAYDLALLVPAGNWIMTGLQNGLSQQMPALEKQLAGVANTVASSMDGVNVDAALKSDAAIATRNALAGVGAASAVSSVTNNKTINFNGDLSFPNITDADDAEEFLQNLFDLAGSGEG